MIRGLVREEVPEFPPVAIREALLNALGHRDHSLSGDAVEVRLIDDAIEIESLAAIAKGVAGIQGSLEAREIDSEASPIALGILPNMRIAESRARPSSPTRPRSRAAWAAFTLCFLRRRCR